MTFGVLQAMSVIVALTLTLTMSPFAEALKGGEWAKPGEFPHAVQLSWSKTGQFFCGGSIFSPNVVITAAHCVNLMELHNRDLTFFKTYTVVTAGTLENRDGKGLKEEEKGMIQTRYVDRYVIHPYFNCSSNENDIALLIFAEPLNYTDKVKGIRLPPRNAVYSGGTLVGWGITDGSNLSSPYLKKIELVLEDRESCNSDPLMMMEPKGRKVTDLSLCAKSRKGNIACKGDSGSSIVCQGSNAITSLHNNCTSESSSLSPTICGIVSFGTDEGLCGESDTINVFVDVSKYLDWIQEESVKNVAQVEMWMAIRGPITCSFVLMWVIIFVETSFIIWILWKLRSIIF